MLRADLAIYNERRERVLTVEIKNIRNASDDWAAQLRRNILAHGNYPPAEYFLLATPDRFFMWANRNSDLEVRSPDYSVNAREFLEPFFKESKVEPADASGFIFEQIVRRWLRSIMYPAYRSTNELPVWVVESGLGTDVFQGDFYFEQAA